MKNYPSTNLRNIAVIGHGKTGKTTLLDACLFNAGTVSRQGNVEQGTSALDTSAEEARHEMTTSLKLAACEWKGYKLNFLDTPGFRDFVADIQGAFAAADSALILISAVSGIEVSTENLWQYANQMDMPRAFFINKMDREHADFNRVVEELRIRFGKGVVPVQMPVGQASSFQGVADLLSLHVKIMTHDAPSAKAEVPAYIQEDVDAARRLLIESVAEFNDELLEKYVDGEEITEVEVQAALIEGIQARKIFPIFCGSAKKNIGIMKMMYDLISYMPTPYFKTSIGENPKTGELKERTTEGTFSAQVFKTTVSPMEGRRSFLRILSGTMRGECAYFHANADKAIRVGKLLTMCGADEVQLSSAAAGDICILKKLDSVKTGDTFSTEDDPICYETIEMPEPTLELAVDMTDKEHGEKIVAALEKECDEEPTLSVHYREETHETTITGMGEMQLEILAEKLQRKYGLKLKLKDPAIPYRETIRKSVKVEGRHKKQSGGHGQFADVWLELTPKEAGSGTEFTEHIFGGAVPRQFIPAVEKGMKETLAEGVLAGFPVVDIHVDLFDGAFHNVDSSEAAFKTATAIAIRKGVKEAAPVILEPIVDLMVKAPEYFTGDVVGRLNAKRARILGIEPAGKDLNVIRALTPLGELVRFTTELRSITQGRGAFHMKFDSYKEMPAPQAEKLIEERKQRK